MNSLFHSLLIFFACFVFVGNLYAQDVGEKYEREVKIKQDEFPKAALDLIEPILRKGEKTKFFKEYSQDDHFFELKTIYKDEKISIKFYKDGSLFDIEILKDFNELPTAVQENIQQYFQSTYKKYQFSRIQIQYNREEEYEDGELEIDDDEGYVKEFLELDLDDLIIKYEIEAEVVKENNERGFYEFLFDAIGEVEQISKIMKRADDNVLY